MDTRKRFVKALALGVFIIGLAAISTRHTVPTQAQAEEPPARRGPHIRASLYGLHTLARGQTARLSAVNTELVTPPDEGRPGRPGSPERWPHHATLAFDIYETVAADGSVKTLRFLRRVSRTVGLLPGEAFSMDFEASRAGETIAAWVLVTPPDLGVPPDQRLAVVSSLEVQQGTRTQFVLPAVRQGFDPQPEPPTQSR
jgi:hypothetical protein